MNPKFQMTDHGVAIYDNGTVEIAIPAYTIRMTLKHPTDGREIEVGFDARYLTSDAMELINRMIRGKVTSTDFEVLEAIDHLSFYAKHRALNRYARNPRMARRVLARVKAARTLSRRAHEKIWLAKEFLYNGCKVEFIGDIVVAVRHTYHPIILLKARDGYRVFRIRWYNRLVLGSALEGRFHPKHAIEQPIEAAIAYLRNLDLECWDKRVARLVDELEAQMVAERLAGK